MTKKSIIIIVVILLLAGGAYFYYSGSSSSSSSSSTLSSDTSAPGSSDSSAAGAQVLSLLNQISSIHIDTNFFTDEAYKSLVDHTVVVPQQNVGRPNPFVAVPGSFVVHPTGATSGTTATKTTGATQ